MASTGGAGIPNVHKPLQCRSLLQVLLGDNCHIYNYEGGGISALGGLAFYVMHNEPNGEILLEDLQAAIRYCKMRLSQSLCTPGCIAGAMSHAAAGCCSTSANQNPTHRRPQLHCRCCQHPTSDNNACAQYNSFMILFICRLLLTLPA